MNQLHEDKIDALSKVYLNGNSEAYELNLHNIRIILKTSIQRDLIPFPLKTTEGASPAFDLVVELFDQSEYFDSSLDWDDSACDQVITESHHHIQRDFIVRECNEDHFQALIDPKNSDGIYNLLRQVLPRYLAAKNQVLVHSSSVRCHNGEAILFLGHSTYGKTTMAELSAPRATLSDDMNILSLNEGVLSVSPSHLGARLESRDLNKLKVREVFWLNKGQKLERTPLSHSRALLYFYASIPSYLDLNQQYPNLSSLIENMAKATPVSLLTFPKNKEIWNELDPN